MLKKSSIISADKDRRKHPNTLIPSLKRALRALLLAVSTGCTPCRSSLTLVLAGRAVWSWWSCLGC